MERLIVLDTETTGIDPKEGHRIIEVGAVQIENREITNTEFHKYVQPSRTVGDSVKVPVSYTHLTLPTIYSV